MTRPTRVLYCSRDFTAHDLRFVRLLTSAGMRVRYLRLEADGTRYVAAGLPRGATWVRWEGGARPRGTRASVRDLTKAFERVVEREAPDVIHAGPVQSFGAMAALANAHPTVLVSWGSDILVDARRDAWHRTATQAALNSCDAFICDSQAVLAAARRMRKRPFPPFVCVPWGPDVVPGPDARRERVRVRRRLGWGNQFVVVASRAWNRGYRVPELVDAFAVAARREPRLRLLLLGDGPERSAVEKRIAAQRLGGQVHTPGMLGGQKLSACLSAGDAYLSLVPSDGSSISLLEAMAHGLACVVVRNAGNAEWVKSGVSGHLVRPGAPGQFADAIVRLAANPGRAAAMGRAAAKIARSRANFPRNAGKLVALYRRAARFAQRGNV